MYRTIKTFDHFSDDFTEQGIILFQDSLRHAAFITNFI